MTQLEHIEKLKTSLTEQTKIKESMPKVIAELKECLTADAHMIDTLLCNANKAGLYPECLTEIRNKLNDLLISIDKLQ